MPDTHAYPLYRAVVEGFEALGAANPQAIRRAVLYRSLTFVGQQFQCEGLRAVWLAGEETVAFHDAQGELLRTVSLEERPLKKAA